jgi:hypothetical protein
MCALHSFHALGLAGSGWASTVASAPGAHADSRWERRRRRIVGWRGVPSFSATESLARWRRRKTIPIFAAEISGLRFLLRHKAEGESITRDHRQVTCAIALIVVGIDLREVGAVASGA